MNKKHIALLLAILTINCILFSSCLGSFRLTHKLHHWNQGIDTKFVNELVFVALIVVPAYPAAVLADILVLNSIEFWSEENPIDEISSIKEIETENGIYTVEKNSNGYIITNKGEDSPIKLVFNEQDNSWNLESNNYKQKIFRYTENNKVMMYLPDGQQMNVTPDVAGLTAFKEVVALHNLYAIR